MSDDILLQRLLEAWESLDDDDRCDLLDHARWLAGESRLRGGPFDGLRIPERLKDAVSVAIECGDRVADYWRGDDSVLSFDGFARTGCEGGTWPDISADDLREMGVEL